MAEPKRDNILMMPKTKRNELSDALRTLLGPKHSSLVEDAGDDCKKIDAHEDSRNSDVDENVSVETTEQEPDIELGEGLEDFEEERSEDDSEYFEDGEVAYLFVDDIAFSPFQTREAPSESELQALAHSLQTKGVLQPIVVRPSSEEESEQRFELVAGERRLRAAQLIGLESVPAIVRNLNDREAAELGVIENAQRENLNPIEEALAYKALIESFKITQKEVAELAGKSRAVISNALRLLQLDDEILDYLKAGDLSAGHGRILLMIDESGVQCRVARRVVKQGLSVRMLEALIARMHESSEDTELDEEQEKQVASVKRAQTRLQNLLDMEALNLSLDGQGRKRLTLTFQSEVEWRRFMAKVR